MPERQLPQDLAPTGTICVPVLLPADDEWIALFLGAVRQLENRYYYGYGNDPVVPTETVAGIFRDTTITPLIDAVASSTNQCGGSSNLTLNEVKRTTQQSLSSGYNVVSFDSGNGFDAGNPTRLTPSAGVKTIIANADGETVNSSGRWRVIIRLNGTTILSDNSSHKGLAQFACAVAGYDFNGTDYVEMLIELQFSGTLHVDNVIPALQAIG